MKLNPFRSSLLISVLAHAAIFCWLWLKVSLPTPRALPTTVSLLAPPPDLKRQDAPVHPQAPRTGQSTPLREASKRATPAVKPTPPGPVTGAASESKLSPPTIEPEARSAGGTAPSSAETRLGEGEADQTAPILPGIAEGGSATVSDGLPAGTGRSPSPGSGPAGPREGAPSADRAEAARGKGSLPTPKSSTPTEVDTFSGVEIPGYVIDAAGHRPPDAGAIYPEIDNYVLYGADKRTPINVAGTNVCIEGEQVRSKDAITIAEIKTDYSRCRYLEFGDDAVPTLRCPPEAHTKIVHHDSYLSSPLVYRVQTCLEYDSSNCYIKEEEETDRELCRVDFEYDGIWEEGTKFYYRCAKSEARIFRQPLQYNIRWFMEIEIHERLTRREFLRERWPLLQCGS